MKYKGKELIPDTEAELMIGIKPLEIEQLLEKLESNNGTYEYSEEDDCEFLEKMEEKIYDLEDVIGYEIWTEDGEPFELDVRCNDVTLDKNGLDILKNIYDVLVSKLKDVRIYILVHIDVDNWFINEKGEEYNEDDAGTWENFISNLTEI